MATDYSTPTWSDPVAPPPPPQAPPRSGWITTSAVLLFVVAALSGLFGVVFLLLAIFLGPAFTEMMSGMPGMPTDGSVQAFAGIFTAVMIVFAVIGIAWAAGHVAAGVGILGGRGWARILGIVLCVLGLLLGILAVVGTVASAGDSEAMLAQMRSDPATADLYAGMTADELAAQTLIGGLAFTLPFVIGYVIVLVTLIRNGAFFERGPR